MCHTGGVPTLCSCRRPRPTCAAASQGDTDATPSAPPLPPELRTSERVKYPTVYKDSDYATGEPGLAEGQPPVEESAFAGDTVEAQEQGEAFTDFQQHSFAQQNTQKPQLFQVCQFPSTEFTRDILKGGPSGR